jgi:serine/threonine-protein kinase HipA
MNESGLWRLSPAYDLTYSVDLAAPAYSNRHSLTVNGKSEEITREDLETVGQNNDIQDYNTLIDDVSGAVVKFAEYAKDLGIDAKLLEAIKADFVLV